MTSPLQLVRRRRATRRTTRGRLGRGLAGIGLGLAFPLAVALGLGLLALGLAYADLTADLPSIEILPELLNPADGQLLQPTRIYDRSGEHLIAVLAPSDAPRTYFFANRDQPIALATVALFDPKFWTHGGFAWGGWDQPDLHPTLAQRLAYDLLLWHEPASIRRALRERILAAQITARYGRLQVLEWSLNSMEYGHYAFGVEAAAQLYFNKPARDLTLAEAAILAATAKAPALNPFDAPTAARQNGANVLGLMHSYGLARLDELEASVKAGLEFAPPPPPPTDLAPEFTALALKQLEQALPGGRVARGGMTVITTLDYDLQVQAACTLIAQLARAAGDTVTRPGASDGTTCEAARLLPALPVDVPIENPRGGVLIIAPRSGQVLAMAGDLSAHESGSVLAPFVYLAGFTRGLSPATLVWDIPDPQVSNYDGQAHGPLRLRLALANDYRVPLARVFEQMGAETVALAARSFGLPATTGTDWIRGDLSVTPLQVAQAYAILANEGTAAGQALVGETLTPVTVLHVRSADGTSWLDWSDAETRAVVTPQLAYLMNHVLADEVARWPSLGHPNLFEIGRPAGVKPGRVEDGRSAWAVGYLPSRVVVTWMGADAPLSPRWPAGLWHAVMQYAARDLPADGWVMPPGVTEMEVCDPSGLLPSLDCPSVVREIFLNGNEPLQVDNLYQRFQINRETGLLATVFTPPELVEERLYLVPPPEARAWAESAGLPVPPTAYDAIQAPPENPDVRITQPALFADLRGVVQIRGTARAPDFDFYRVQVGQGLNPQRWLQVGGDVRTPVEDGLLAEWDTNGLNGLYALRLLVVHTDRRVDIATIQVTVDNTPPEVSILFPQQGETLPLAENREISFQAQVSDNLGLSQVDFFLDGRPLGRMTGAPFRVRWTAQIGTFTLQVRATDRAGNVAEGKVQFTVRR